MPKGLELWKPAYQTVAYQGVPMFRCQAWALHDYVLHGGHLIVNSADRRKGVAEKFGKQSQAALWEGWNARKPGFFPANPPGFSSHELRSDGHAFYGPRGKAIPNYKLGIDAVHRLGGDAHLVVSWLNRHGYEAKRPYAASSERHHFSFAKSPATNARKRLRAWKAAGRKPNATKVSQRGIDLIKKYEGYRAKPYKPVAGEQFWTWGYGHYGPDVPLPTSGKTISKDRAEKLLKSDVERFAAGVRAAVKTRLNQNQFDALVSFAYNVGLGNFQSSTLLKRVNERRFVYAAAEFRKWVKGGSPLKTLPGLVRRRAEEAALFMRPAR
jgi:lysozyme